MAYPIVVGTALSSRANSLVNDDVDLPLPVASGDLLLVFHATDGATTRTFSAGWTLIKEGVADSSANNVGIAYKIAAGGETTVTATKSVSERFTAIALRISAASWHGSTPPEVSTGATGNSASPNPDTHTASWGSAENLFIAIVAYDNSAGGGRVSAWPTNYTGSNLDSDDVLSAGCVAVGTRNLTGASDDPDVFTMTSDNWWAGTVVVRAGGSPPAVSLPFRSRSPIGHVLVR